MRRHLGAWLLILDVGYKGFAFVRTLTTRPRTGQSMDTVRLGRAEVYCLIAGRAGGLKDQ